MRALVLILLLPFFAHASGKLSLESRHNVDSGDTTYLMGLAIYQKLGPVAYNSWTGFGDSMEWAADYSAWAVSKHQVDFPLGRSLTVSPGIRFVYANELGLGQEVTAKVTYQLW